MKLGVIATIDGVLTELYGDLVLGDQRVWFAASHVVDRDAVVVACMSHGVRTTIEVDVFDVEDGNWLANKLRELPAQHEENVKANSQPPDWRPNHMIPEDFYT